MADNEIDIEEHNLFENPTIQRIFPDLSILKMEVTDTIDEGVKAEFFYEENSWDHSSQTDLNTDVNLCSPYSVHNVLKDQWDNSAKNNHYHNIKQYYNTKKVHMNNKHKLNNIINNNNPTTSHSIVIDHKYLPKVKMEEYIESSSPSVPSELTISNKSLQKKDTYLKMEISQFSDSLDLRDGTSNSNMLIHFFQSNLRDSESEVSSLTEVNKNNHSENDCVIQDENSILTEVEVENGKLSENSTSNEDNSKITYSEIHVLKNTSISKEHFDSIDSATKDTKLSMEIGSTREHYKNICAKSKGWEEPDITSSKKKKLNDEFQITRKKSFDLNLKKRNDKSIYSEIDDRKLSDNSKNTQLEMCASSTNIKTYLSKHEKLKLKKPSNSHINPTILPLQANKIILGSKPNANVNRCKEMNIVVKNVKIPLENIETFLSKSSRYCKKCSRLFPSTKTLSDHNNFVHFQRNNKLCGESLSNSKRGNALNVNVNRFKCNLCKKVFTSLNYLIRHKQIIHFKKHNVSSVKHNLAESCPTSKETKTFKCTHCDKKFLTQQLLIDHMYEILQSKNKNVTESARSIEIQPSIKKTSLRSTNKNVTESTQNIEIQPSLKKTSLKTNNYYRCSSCLYYFLNRNFYVKHKKRKHKKKAVFNFKKVDFDPTCKICLKKYCSVNSFNKHVWYHHLRKTAKLNLQRNNKKLVKMCKEEVPEKNGEKETKEQLSFGKKQKDFVHNISYVLKSVLFKCIKCDVHFLSSKKAADHYHHLESLINWKCLKCMRIFKKEDEVLHSYQHLFSDTFDVYEISKANISFFKCPNCLTYFLEQDLFNHFNVCEMQQPNSAYCKVCDTLIDNKIKELHSEYHEKRGNATNIIFVESELIEYNTHKFNQKNPSNDIELKMVIDSEDKTITDVLSKGDRFSHLEQREERIMKKMLSFTYCDKCKSYISGMHNLYNHTKDPCTHLTKFVCKYCGLLISNKIIDRHRMLHQRVLGLTLNDFKFYDLKGHKITRPPIPKYPTCPKCLKHFITKTAIISHKCSEDYLTCPLCNIKLSDSAFPLHMAFHYYLPKNEVPKIPNDKTDFFLPVKLSAQELKPHLYHTHPSKENYERNQLLVYMCKNCKVAVDFYDAVIEHCQDHISDPVKETFTKPCEACNIIFNISCYENHKNLHAKNNTKKFTVLSYDAFYATANRNVWLDHLFGSLPKEEIHKILGKSIYNIERRIKLQVIQVGLSDITLFKCNKCESYMDASLLYDHCHVDILCYKSKPAPCSHCGINLISEESRVKHEKIHGEKEIKPKSYRIVLFNRDEDKNINKALSLPNKYILFECRKCNGIVDTILYDNHKCCVEELAKCSHCGLLLYANDYMPHVLKHKEFCSFNENNMKVILIGQFKNGPKIRGRLTPSFKGERLDYILYQCFQCHVCVKEKGNILKHVCLTASSMTKCLVCGLYIEDSQFKNHHRLHECDALFIKENITVVSFRCTKDGELDRGVILIDDEDDLKKGVEYSENYNRNTIKDNVMQSSKNIINKKIEIYKCTCDLHFLNESSALAHFTRCNTNSKYMKQVCPKCDLCFLPSEMFKHVLAHHGNKNNNTELEIIQISENIKMLNQCD